MVFTSATVGSLAMEVLERRSCLKDSSSQATAKLLIRFIVSCSLSGERKSGDRMSRKKSAGLKKAGQTWPREAK